MYKIKDMWNAGENIYSKNLLKNVYGIYKILNVKKIKAVNSIKKETHKLITDIWKQIFNENKCSTSVIINERGIKRKW